MDDERICICIACVFGWVLWRGREGMSVMAALLRDIEIPFLDWHSMGWVVLF